MRSSPALLNSTDSVNYFVGRAAMGSQENRYPADCPDLRLVLIFNSERAIILRAFGVEATYAELDLTMT